MVMYTSDVNSHTLTLDYDKVPGAQEVIRDILNAPIDVGETFQNKQKGKNVVLVKDEKIKINAKLGKKALAEVMSSEALTKAGFYFGNDKNKLDLSYIYIPESELAEQSSMMEN